MKNQDEILEAYIQKVLEIQQQQQSQGLSSEDLAEIARNMGIPENELENARSAYLTRGQGFLKYGNWEDAIKEFQQLLILNPNNSEVLYNIAVAYAGLYEQNHRDKDKEQAIKYAQIALQIRPDYEAAIKLISTLKKTTQQTGYQQAYPNYQTYSKTPTNNQKTALITFIVVVIALSTFVVIGVGILISSSTNRTFSTKEGTTTQSTREEVKSYFKSTSTSISAFKALVGKKGAVVWTVSYIQTNTSKGIRRQHYIHIINPETGTVLKEIPIADDYKLESFWTNLQSCPEGFYNVNEKENTWEVRDMYTGEIVGTPEILSKKYQQLRVGIGKIKYSSGWFEITTKDGDEYFYSIEQNLLATKEEKEKSENDYRNKINWVNEYRWYFVKDRNKSMIGLVKDKVSPFRIYEYSGKTAYNDSKESFERRMNNSYRGNGEVLAFNTEKKYFEPIFLYGDADLCVFYHPLEIGNNPPFAITAIDNKGKILWEIFNPTSVMLQALNEKNRYGFKTTRYQNTLVIYSHYLSFKGKNAPYSSGIDLNTGKLLWEYSPKD
ncbi:MAG: tetratricopeptide repeat protein [Cytophagales bacterium]|nr:MAG: tetratricopeptide repeat protein [Cytophagales bacterium]